VRIEEVLENPGIWQKTTVLVPDTSVTQDSSITFSLVVADLQTQFDSIEKETGISADVRHVAISAYITGDAGTSVQDLPISMDKSIIYIDSGLTQADASGSGSFSYVVNLKPNDIYSSSILYSPAPNGTTALTVINPGQQIFAKLVDHMDVTFAYQLTGNGTIGTPTTDTTITVVLESPDLWSKTFTITSERDNGPVGLSFQLDIPGYMSLIQAIETETGSSSDTYNLTVTANVHTTAQTGAGG